LRVQDLAGNDVGVLDSWTLTLSGGPADGVRTYVYTDDFATLADGARREALSDADGGLDSLNAAAVTSNTMIDLPSGLASISGHLVDLSGTFEWIYTGDGADTVIGAGADDWVNAGRG